MSEQHYLNSLSGPRLLGAAGTREDWDGTIVRCGGKSERVPTRQRWWGWKILGARQQLNASVPQTDSHCELGMDMYLRWTGHGWLFVLAALELWVDKES